MYITYKSTSAENLSDLKMALIFPGKLNYSSLMTIYHKTATILTHKHNSTANNIYWSLI